MTTISTSINTKTNLELISDIPFRIEFFNLLAEIDIHVNDIFKVTKHTNNTTSTYTIYYIKNGSCNLIKIRYESGLNKIITKQFISLNKVELKVLNEMIKAFISNKN